MSIQFCPLASGSKGNCLYVKTAVFSFLIDLGISYIQLEKRLQELEKSSEEIQAILISHEHGDHIAGLPSFLKKRKIPIYANAETAKGIYHALEILPEFKIFTTDEPFWIEDAYIHPFPISHDTLDPVGFSIEIDHKIRLGICTDLGIVTPTIKKRLGKSHLLYIEANHEISHVHSSLRPNIYKERVLSRQGHLSNEACGNLILDIAHPELRQIFLAHLSQECNSKERALATIQEILKKKNIMVPISIAYQERISNLITL